MEQTLGRNRWTIVHEANSEEHLRTSEKPVERNNSKSACDEINAYIAIRDSLLAEAEEGPTSAALHRACFVNEVVELFLKPARPPYESHRPEADAIREGERCAAVKVRIAELRALIAERSGGHTCVGAC
ncbi:MAG: hypothetical protein M3O66_02300 [Verrucomicrobiota bacterium]|jgi:hypothetical protein|nr:hypothetical protein [Verrucomicrobiota bacterium]